MDITFQPIGIVLVKRQGRRLVVEGIDVFDGAPAPGTRPYFFIRS